MNSYISLVIAALLPALATAVLYLLKKKTKYGDIPKPLRDVIVGVVFGCLAIIGTEWGIPINGAQVNCRDAAVLCAGLFFSGPSGIIAGFIGGIERWIAVAWGVGTYTRVACSVSTIIAGFYAAAIRKYLLDKKFPGWSLSFAIGIVMETFHLTMVFLTHLDATDTALEVIINCNAPMLIANATSVALGSCIISILAGHNLWFTKGAVRLSDSIQRWLLVMIVVTFALTTQFVYTVQTSTVEKQIDERLVLALDEAEERINECYETSDVLSLSQYNYVLETSILGEKGYLLMYHKSASENPGVRYEEVIDKISYVSMDRNVGNIKLVASMNSTEAYSVRLTAVYVNTYMEILVFAALYGLIYMLIKNLVVDKLNSVNGSLATIRQGKLEEKVNVRSNKEFVTLSDDINATVDTLKEYINAANERMAADLANAKTIQSSVLPSKFPAFIKRDDFDIYARMDTAKEVGGDFYDFYLTQPNLLHILIADVSGKGIPAALFMMRSKTELSNLTKAEHPINEVFALANQELCKGNQANMFVTAWQGGINLETGLVEFACAGHNPPIVMHKGGKFEYLKQRANLVLAGMEGIPYRKQEFNIQKGDVIFLYTDGVTEATSIDKELYGEQRLLDRLNSREFLNMKDLCDYVYEDVMAFTGEADQFDDITMLAFKYADGPIIKSGTESKALVPVVQHKYYDSTANISEVSPITAFVEDFLNEIECPMKDIMRINIAIDELYSNVANYAYPNGTPGPCRVEVARTKELDGAVVTFIDSGIPYNPLLREDPDITLSAEERGVGGLGVFMVKKTMDEVLYDYKNGENILTIVKRFK